MQTQTENYSSSYKWEVLRQEYGGRCAKCKSTAKLQFAHQFPSGLEGYGRGKNKRYWNIVNHPLSYVLLCENCHKEYDRYTGTWRSHKKKKVYIAFRSFLLRKRRGVKNGNI
jgi:hypothetical protein